MLPKYQVLGRVTVDGDPLKLTEAHLAVISHDIPHLLLTNFLELGVLNVLLDVLGRVDELILLNQCKYRSLYRPSLNLFVISFLQHLVEGSFVLFDFGNYMRNAGPGNAELLSHILHFIMLDEDLICYVDLVGECESSLPLLLPIEHKGTGLFPFILRIISTTTVLP